MARLGIGLRALPVAVLAALASSCSGGIDTLDDGGVHAAAFISDGYTNDTVVDGVFATNADGCVLWQVSDGSYVAAFPTGSRIEDGQLIVMPDGTTYELGAPTQIMGSSSAVDSRGKPLPLDDPPHSTVVPDECPTNLPMWWVVAVNAV